MDEYIIKSKQQINNYLYENDYQKAFNMLILVLETIDKENIYDFIEYYNDRIFNKKKEEFVIKIKKKRKLQ